VSPGQEVASYWYSAVRQYNYSKEPDVLHANVNAGNKQHARLACREAQTITCWHNVVFVFRGRGVWPP
jgi:hypothetical protein